MKEFADAAKTILHHDLHLEKCDISTENSKLIYHQNINIGHSLTKTLAGLMSRCARDLL